MLLVVFSPKNSSPSRRLVRSAPSSTRGSRSCTVEDERNPAQLLNQTVDVVSTEAQGHPTNMVFLDLVVHEHLQCGIYDKFLLLLDMPLIPGTISEHEYAECYRL
ncbi:hypothetical protein KCU85_g389, partial [Aureobasidium melanogenum]